MKKSIRKKLGNAFQLIVKTISESFSRAKTYAISKRERFQRFRDKQRTYFSFSILSKNRGFFIGYIIIAGIVGIIYPDIDNYELLLRATETGLFPFSIKVIVVALLFAINWAIVFHFLKSKYAIDNQAFAASIFAFLILFTLAYTGFWLRDKIENTSQSFCEIFELENCIPDFQPPFNAFSAATTIASSFTIFSVVYGFVSGPLIKADYLKFQLRLKMGKDSLGRLYAIEGAFDNLFLYSKEINRIFGYFNDALAELEKVIPYEPSSYGTFIDQHFSGPLVSLKDFYETYEIGSKPNLFNKLVENIDKSEPATRFRLQYRILLESLERI